MWTFCNDVPGVGVRVLYMALPVMMAAAAHVVVIRYDLLRRLKVPIDLGWTIRGRRGQIRGAGGQYMHEAAGGSPCVVASAPLRRVLWWRKGWLLKGAGSRRFTR